MDKRIEDQADRRTDTLWGIVNFPARRLRRNKVTMQELRILVLALFGIEQTNSWPSISLDSQLVDNLATVASNATSILVLEKEFKQSTTLVWTPRSKSRDYGLEADPWQAKAILTPTASIQEVLKNQEMDSFRRSSSIWRSSAILNTTKEKAQQMINDQEYVKEIIQLKNIENRALIRIEGKSPGNQQNQKKTRRFRKSNKRN